jgi:formylglycine-generating enzyme required for sulfatase activity
MATYARGAADNFVEPAMVRIPEGWFCMGSESGLDCEKPVHRVWVDAFEMAATQVTNAEYVWFLRATGRAEPPFWRDANFNHPQQPVVAVSWFEATEYCEWLSQRPSNPSERRYRLPTEAEWERAARGGWEGKLFPWGDDPPQSLPGYEQRWLSGTERVAQFTPNGYQLHNMCDNVHEWCSDWFDADYYRVSPEQNPRGPGGGKRKASRGGSWRHHIKVSRCYTRSSIPPEFKYADYGFRMAADV